MNNLIEFYNNHHFLFLLSVIVFFIIYISKYSKKEYVTIPITNSEDYIDDTKIKNGSVVKIKYILTNHIITIKIVDGTKSDLIGEAEIKRINKKNPLAISLINKQIGDIVKFKIEENSPEFNYVEILDIDFIYVEDNIKINHEMDVNQININSNNNEIMEQLIDGNFIIRMEENNPLTSKDDLIQLLQYWVDQTGGPKENLGYPIGDYDNFGKTPWIYISLNNEYYFINADTNKKGVIEFLENHKNQNPWIIVANRNGVFNKVTNNKDGNSIKYLYFYAIVGRQNEIII